MFVTVVIRCKNIIFPDSLNVPVVKKEGSPVAEILSDILFVDKKDSKAIYLQLSEQLASAIQGGILKPGSVLPGTRQLSAILKLHRKTIVASYEELALQGFVTMHANRGTFVNQEIPDSIVVPQDDTPAFSQKTIVAIPNNRLLELEYFDPKEDWILDDGKFDSRFWQQEKMSAGSYSLLGKSYNNSSSFLKYLLSQYIVSTQNIIVSENQLLITSNQSMCVALITQALLNTGDIVVVGNPGNYKINMAIQQVGAELKSISVEVDGLDMAALEEVCKKQTIKMLYISPQHHYPTTTICSYAKRLELLRLANQYRFFILEDQTESLCDFQKRKIPSLAALDSEGVVIQVNSFEQMIRPDWNIGFIVASPAILHEIEKYKSYIGLDYMGLAENMMAATLQSENLQRIVKKMTKHYLQRRNMFCQLLSEHWREYVQYEVSKTGLGLWLHFDWDFNLLAFAKKCTQNGLVIPNYLLYQSRKWTAMRLGFGKWNDAEMEAVVLTGRQSF